MLHRKTRTWKSRKKNCQVIDILGFHFELPKPRCPKRGPFVTPDLASYATHPYVYRVLHDVEIRSDFDAIAVIYEASACAPVRRRNHTQPSWG